jgi:hypothetical protein
MIVQIFPLRLFGKNPPSINSMLISDRGRQRNAVIHFFQVRRALNLRWYAMGYDFDLLIACLCVHSRYSVVLAAVILQADLDAIYSHGKLYHPSRPFYETVCRGISPFSLAAFASVRCSSRRRALRAATSAKVVIHSCPLTVLNWCGWAGSLPMPLEEMILAIKILRVLLLYRPGLVPGFSRLLFQTRRETLRHAGSIFEAFSA